MISCESGRHAARERQSRGQVVIPASEERIGPEKTESPIILNPMKSGIFRAGIEEGMLQIRSSTRTSGDSRSFCPENHEEVPEPQHLRPWMDLIGRWSKCCYVHRDDAPVGDPQRCRDGSKLYICRMRDLASQCCRTPPWWRHPGSLAADGAHAAEG